MQEQRIWTCSEISIFSLFPNDQFLPAAQFLSNKHQSDLTLPITIFEWLLTETHSSFAGCFNNKQEELIVNATFWKLEEPREGEEEKEEKKRCADND